MKQQLEISNEQLTINGKTTRFPTETFGNDKKVCHCEERSDEAILPFSRRFGFTLVELVLVISIVVVLSVISGPIYRSYAYKARQAEGYALIGTIRSAQESYCGEYGNFYTRGVYTCNDEVLGIDARANKYYTAFVPSWGQSGDSHKYRFSSVVAAINAANITMAYNRTSGVTMFSGFVQES